MNMLAISFAGHKTQFKFKGSSDSNYRQALL